MRREPRQCETCGGEYVPVRRDQRFDSRACAVKDFSKRSVRGHQPSEAVYKREWQRRNKDKVARYVRASNMRRKRGIELEEFEALVLAQDSRCLICGVEALLEPDHDHVTGAFRGAICGACNRGLGQFRDDPDRLLSAAAYLLERDSLHPALGSLHRTQEVLKDA